MRIFIWKSREKKYVVFSLPFLHRVEQWNNVSKLSYDMKNADLFSLTFLLIFLLVIHNNYFGLALCYFNLKCPCCDLQSRASRLNWTEYLYTAIILYISWSNSKRVYQHQIFAFIICSAQKVDSIAVLKILVHNI